MWEQNRFLSFCSCPLQGERRLTGFLRLKRLMDFTTSVSTWRTNEAGYLTAFITANPCEQRKRSGTSVSLLLYVLLLQRLIDFRNFAFGKLCACFGIVYEGAAVIIHYIYFLSIDSVFLDFHSFKLFYTFWMRMQRWKSALFRVRIVHAEPPLQQLSCIIKPMQ